jgi:hypothetical protein
VIGRNTEMLQTRSRKTEHVCFVTQKDTLQFLFLHHFVLVFERKQKERVSAAGFCFNANANFDSMQELSSSPIFTGLLFPL